MKRMLKRLWLACSQLKPGAAWLSSSSVTTQLFFSEPLPTPPPAIFTAVPATASCCSALIIFQAESGRAGTM